MERPATSPSLTLLGSPQQYDPDENDQGDMKRLDKRHMTLTGGATYRQVAEWGIVRSTLLDDMLNNSNGIFRDLAWLYRFDSVRLASRRVSALRGTARINIAVITAFPNMKARVPAFAATSLKTAGRRMGKCV